MNARLDFFAAAPADLQPLVAFSQSTLDSGLEHSLIHLVKLRASQINGCSYCIHMHTREARKDGESEERLYLLDAWEESSLYSDRERAALRWTEALTLLAETRAPDDVYDEMARHFAPEEQVKLTLLIAAINTWNRLAVGFRSQHPKAKAAAA
jgi:AhpD family alkylhydroperoxidase